MKIKESSIEKKINDETPSCVYGISRNIEKYDCNFFNIVVNFKDTAVFKGFDENGNLTEHKYGIPDFILLNKKDKVAIDELCDSFERGEVVDYKLNDYFASRSNLYFIEAFGDYWHDKQITGVDKEKHEQNVRNAYEASGHHVLILWENDIVNRWEEKCLPLINEFIEKFKGDGNELPDNEEIKPVVCMSDSCIQSMHNIDYRNSLDSKKKKNIVDEMCLFYQNLGNVSINKYDAKLDYYKLSKWADVNRNDKMQKITRFGKLFLWHAFPNMSRFIMNENGLTLEYMFHDQNELQKAIIDLMNSEKEINFLSILWKIAENNGISNEMPFDVSELVFRIHSNCNSEISMMLDPCCHCGETLVASYLLGVKKYVGFADSALKKKSLESLAEWIGYSDVRIILSERNNLENIERYCEDRCMILSCSNDTDIFNDLSEMVSNDRQVMLCNKTGKTGEICEKAMKCRIDFWERDVPTGYVFYKLIPKDNYNYVTCKECGLSFSSLRGHLYKIHGMLVDDYKKAYPEARITSLSESDKIAQSNRTKYDGIENHHYNKRYVYLMPDGGYASKSDKYKRAWGVNEVKPEHIIDASTIDYIPDYAKGISGKEGVDFVKCAICGVKKGSLTQHLRKIHGLTVDEYEKTYGSSAYSEKNKEAFHKCALNKWKTQFENGTSQHAVPKEHSENNPVRKQDDLTAEKLGKMLKDGYTQIEMCKELDCSDVTLRKWMNENGLEMPSRTVTAIRKAVKEGAELNLEMISVEDVAKMLKDIGKDRTMARFGVRRTVFDSWIAEKKQNMSESQKLAVFGGRYEKEIPKRLEDGEIVSFLKQRGFPYPKTEDYDLENVVSMIRNSRNVIDSEGNIGMGFSAGNDALLTFFPNFFEVSQHGGRSAKWYFDNKLEHILSDIREYGGKYPTLSLVRTYLMEHEGISGFRPVVAKQIYDRYCPNNAIILDPCGGWGGRMLGAYCSDKVVRYDCIDASKNTCKGLEKVKDAFGEFCTGKKINVSCGAFEDQHLESGIYDMVFTSPPYFKKERYSEDGMQSCNRYEEYDIWKESFLSEFVDKSYDCLKINGWFIVNIDNVKINNDEFSLQDDLKELALKKGFVLKETLFMKSRNRYVGTESGEPIFVFLKP